MIAEVGNIRHMKGNAHIAGLNKVLFILNMKTWT